MRAFVVVLCVSVLLTGTFAAPALLGESRIANELIPALSALEVDANAPTPVCLFVHGLGQSPAKDEVLSTFPIKDYWGADIPNTVGKYCTIKYVHYNSQSRAWTDKGLQQTVCNLIKQSEARIVFSHSMGSNVIGMAIANNIPGCDFQEYKAGAKIAKGKRAWVSIQGVFGGSVASDFCVRMCGTKLGETVKGTIKDAIALAKDFDDLAKLVKLRDVKEAMRNLAAGAVEIIPKARKSCVCNGGKAGPAIASCSVPQTPAAAWATLQASVKKNAWRQTCGLGPFPVALKWMQSLFMPVPYFLLEGLEGWGKDLITRREKPMTGTDGFVSFTSCKAGRNDDEWLPTPTARLYVGRMNHADGTGRTGDGKDIDKKPLTFMVESAKQLIPLLEW